MKNLNSYVVEKINADEKAPIVLVEQHLDGLTLRWALSKSNITFPSGGTAIYYARTFGISEVGMAADGQIDTVTVDFDNVDASFDTYLESYDFQGRLMRVMRVYRSGESEVLPSDASQYNEVFFGEMDQPSCTDPAIMSFPANSGDSIDPPMLNKYYGSFCQHRFGDDNCTVNLLDTSYYSRSGEATGGTTSILKATALTQASDFWKYGTVKIEHDSISYSRKVKNYSKGTGSGEVHVDIALPVTITAGDDFEIQKGCDFTWDTCASNNAWGPSGENTNNFLGFIHIGMNREN